MKELSISFEGGPIIIGPAGNLADWHGVESNNYDDLCAVFDTQTTDKVHLLPGHEANSIAVDFGGAGTVRIFPSDKGLVLIRAWPSDPDSDSVYFEALGTEYPFNESGEIVHDSDTIAVAWAAECLAGLPSSADVPMFPEIDQAVDGSVLLHPLAIGRYRWTKSEFELPSGAVIRLNLERI